MSHPGELMTVHEADGSFEKRRMGFFDLMEGYRKSDALLGQTYFDGLHNDPESVQRLKNSQCSVCRRVSDRLTLQSSTFTVPTCCCSDWAIARQNAAGLCERGGR